MHGTHKDADAPLEDLDSLFHDDIENGISEQKPNTHTGISKPAIASSSTTPKFRPNPSRKAFGIFSSIKNKRKQDSRHLEQEIQTPSPMHNWETLNNEIQARQQSCLEAIILVKKHIDDTKMVLKQTEQDRKKEGEMAIDAENKQKIYEVTQHEKKAARLENRAGNLDNQLKLINKQLVALEYVVLLLETEQDLLAGSEVPQNVVVHDDEFKDILQDNPELLKASNTVKAASNPRNALKKDTNLNRYFEKKKHNKPKTKFVL